MEVAVNDISCVEPSDVSDRHLRGTTSLQADRIPWAAMAGIIATVTVFAVAQGLTYPLLSFILERQGTPSGLIGLSAAMTPLGFILSAPFIPALSQRLGGARLAILCSILAALILMTIAWAQDVWAWMPLRFLLGVFANPLYVISETWLISITPAPRRGRIMGLYSSIVSGGFAIGPLSLWLTGTEGWPPFAIGITAFLLCGLIVFAVIPRLPDMPGEGEATTVGRFFALAPLLLFAVFTAAAFEQILLSLFAVYGTALGSAEERIASLITCFIAGNAVLQILLGRLAERFSSTRMMLFCVLACLASCLLLPSAFNSWLIWPLVFVWGGVSFGIYTLSLIQLGERFTGQALIAGNATFALVWGIGGIVGSPATGLAMQLIGHQGLPSSLGLLSCVLAALLMARRSRG
ncbi:MFS transporter [Rhizobium leguminosarum]|uniref:MFS transporter n=1 Tax=Rhizobium leguminosarum TaxID=384 RepID=A0AAJ1A582_RHILE|nr:MFS transporter [Rhizobium leguminosarum]MBY5533281.1 MFS transporter [Rhizobium leguminosarum]MBY5593828.1 MFS transporter [Rhizobium leguminosarum]MBY5614469.1 MFS transporter [Rhizobium leguminosarum]MBY5627569.1 MFS transporter [Rhizobium leguminosarum]MBY5729131.1 MFS transporter [Rhizobium leguminosarum]